MKHYVIGCKKHGKIINFFGGNTLKDVESSMSFHLENSAYNKTELLKEHMGYVKKEGYTSFFSSQKGFEDFTVFFVEDNKFQS